MDFFIDTNITFKWWVIALIVIWDAVWKLLAIWKAAQNNHKGWFLAIAILNTLGLLPIAYIYYFSKK